MADVDMKPVDEKEKTTTEETKEVPKRPPPTPAEEIRINVSLIERGVVSLEPRYTHRVLRSLASLRKRLDSKALQDAITVIYPAGLFTVYLLFVQRANM